MTDATGTRAQWRWLADSYWYVLPTDLPALSCAADGEALTWLIDQTLWHITGYENGYFWGVTAALMYDAGEPMPQRGPASRISHLTLLGTVLPSGGVQITFRTQRRLGASTIVGIGQLLQRGEAWAFEMQMSTDRGDERVLHWANMVQTRPGEPSWQQLPGLPYSVPELLEGAVYPRFDR